jgi:exopolysaccharide biosynthesis polyprenyl glycosylphosphotransferase
VAERTGTGEDQFAQSSRPADAATTWQMPAVVTTESIVTLADPAPVSPAPAGASVIVPDVGLGADATRAVNTAGGPGLAVDSDGDQPLGRDDQARLIGVDTADAAVLRIRRVMTEALGRGRLAETTSARWRAVWPMSNSNDLTVEIDRAGDEPSDVLSDLVLGPRTLLDAKSGDALDVAGLPIDSTPTVVLRSALGAAATVDAILATLDVPTVAATPMTETSVSHGSISGPDAANVADVEDPSAPGPVVDDAADDDTADDGEVRGLAPGWRKPGRIDPDHRPGLGRHAVGGRVRATWEVGYVVMALVADLVAGLVGGAVAFAARFGDQVNDINRAYVFVSAVLPGLFLLSLWLSRAYERRFLFVGTDEYQRVLRAGVFMTALTATLSYAFVANLARGYVVLALPVATLLCLGARFVLRQWLHRRRAQGECLSRVIVVGHELAVVAIARQLGRELYHGLEVVGCCLPPEHDDDVGMPVYGTFGDVAAAVRAAGADTVLVLSCPELDGHMLRRLAWRLERDDIDLIVASSLVDVAGSRATVRPVDGLPMLHVEHPRLSGAGRVVKSVFDRVIATAGLMLLAPLFMVAALAIRATSPGPVLFRQVRIGKAGRRFVMYKFRTMVVDAESRKHELVDLNHGDGVLFKIRSDPRVTPVGRWMRRLSIDELPQLINVVRGEMSLVGPRPPLPEEVAAYPSDMRRRLAVSPGLTGLWQVSGRSDLSWEETVRLDLRYVENWSFSLDLVILLRTLSAVCRSSGAY